MKTSDHGFTLIELLIVVVIIGILSAIAIPKFASTKERSYLATMKSDLRNLVTAQEGYLGDNGTYYSGAVPNLAAIPYQPSTGSDITIVSVVASGWSAPGISRVFVSRASNPTVHRCWRAVLRSCWRRWTRCMSSASIRWAVHCALA